jgi:hypothetical protein
MNPFQKFLLALKALFVKDVHKVESILTNFKKTVNRLEAATEHHLAQAAEHGATILEAQAKKFEAESEANLAKAVATNISKLLQAPAASNVTPIVGSTDGK